MNISAFLKANGFVTGAEVDREQMLADFLVEMDRGLAGERSSLQMIPAYLRADAEIRRGAKVAVLDAGGTNLRSALVTIPGGVSERQNQPMPGSVHEVGAEEFFSTLAREVRRVHLLADTARIGFCFSYNAERTPDLDAYLKEWNKGIRAPEVVGTYVGRELLARLGGGSVAIVNDTVATLLAAKAACVGRDYAAFVGFILGTGTNVAYAEPSRQAQVINSESGGFDKVLSSSFDRAMDAKLADTGQYPLEKMIAGAYLGPLGLEVLRAAGKAGLLSVAACGSLGELDALASRDLDDFTAGVSRADNPLEHILTLPEDRTCAKALGQVVFERAAVLAAVQLAAFVIRSGKEGGLPVAVNIDGSTYYKTKSVSFPEVFRRELDDLAVRRRGIAYEILPEIVDAPLLGAALAALACESRERDLR